MKYMLAYPYGDAVRLMSSYVYGNEAGESWRLGPPGVGNNTLRDVPSRVWEGDSPAHCLGTPDGSPVALDYENQTDKQWVCEHRWDGIAGMVRFRRLVGIRHTVKNRIAHPQVPHGRIAFSLDNVAFVALTRGHNWFTRLGSNETWDLRGVQTGLPPGTYFDMARGSDPFTEKSDPLGIYVVTWNDLPVHKGFPRKSATVNYLEVNSRIHVLQLAEAKDEGRVRARIKHPAGWVSLRTDTFEFAVKADCLGDVVVGTDGKIANGTVESSSVLAIHVRFRVENVSREETVVI